MCPGWTIGVEWIEDGQEVGGIHEGQWGGWIQDGQRSGCDPGWTIGVEWIEDGRGWVGSMMDNGVDGSRIDNGVDGIKNFEEEYRSRRQRYA